MFTDRANNFTQKYLVTPAPPQKNMQFPLKTYVKNR